MTYSQVKEYLYSFINYESLSHYSYNKSFKLERFKDFLKIVGSPQSDLKVIHVAGSKGKGSACIFIANMLKQSGFRVGLYTSPHLIDFRERIRILHKSKSSARRTREFEGMISQEDVCRLVENLKPKINKFNKDSKCGALTFFEVYTALAFQYFKDKKVDFVILETGLGGRLDATNTCRDILSVITPLSLEHTYLLGRTVKEIALEKASIIKKTNQKSLNGKTIALSAKQDRRAMDVIQSITKRNNAFLLKQERDFNFIRKNNTFDYKERSYKIRGLKINLSGGHQIANATLAIASVRALRYHNINIDDSAIRQGLNDSIWPARFEIISKNPTVIIDGAQNSASVKALNQTIKEIYPKKRIWLIFGIAKDKELKDTCGQIEKITENIILTKYQNPRASEPKDLLDYFQKKPAMLTDTSKAALNLVRSVANKDDLIVVTGSLYLCAEVRN